MHLLDRFGQRALVMAGFELVVFLGVVAYAFWPPSLGTHATAVILAMGAAFAVLVWMTLVKPWDFDLAAEDPGLSYVSRMQLFAPGRLIMITIGLGALYGRILGHAKEQTRELASLGSWEEMVRADDLAEWNADVWGLTLVSGPNLFLVVFLPAILLALLWWILG